MELYEYIKQILQKIQILSENKDVMKDIFKEIESCLYIKLLLISGKLQYNLDPEKVENVEIKEIREILLLKRTIKQISKKVDIVQEVRLKIT